MLKLVKKSMGVSFLELKKEDRRVRKTKKLLRQGLSQLMLEKSIKDITVRELAELVDINRGTFYIHYRDIYDMVAQLEAEIFEELSAILNRHKKEDDIDIETAVQALLEDLLTYVADNRELCLALLGKNGDIAFLNNLQQMIHAECIKLLVDNFPQVKMQNLEYLYEYSSAGGTAIIRAWLSQGMKESPAEMAELTRRMIAGTLGNVLI